MANEKYTPGPWEADHCSERRIKDDPGHWQIDGPTPKGLNNTMPYTVADTMNRNYCISPEEDLANARLIAASPDLLEAVKAVHESKGWWSLECEVQQAIKAAIKKAETRE